MSNGVPSIGSVECTQTGLVVGFAGIDEPLLVAWRWVRDHSEDAASLDPANLQRLVDTFSLAPDVAASGVVFDDHVVSVGWSDGSADSQLSAALLAEVAGVVPTRRPTLWGAGSMPSASPVADVADVMGSDDALRSWLEAVDAVGFGVVSSMPTSREAAADLAHRVGIPRSSIFGAMWSLSSELTDHADSAYSQTFLEPHTDGSYSHDAPGLQMFACLERTGTGGESILVDGFAVAERLRAEQPAHFALLTAVAVPSRYLEPGVHLRATRPTIRVDAAGRPMQITFNNYDRAPFALPPEQMEAWYDAYASLHRLVVDRDHWMSIRLEPGDVLLFDNWRTLHGRMAYTGARLFEGCYHHREDFESRLRVLRADVASQDRRGARPA
jgi:alpha-ketoglutarate-dependent taurine dioxygenase